MIIEYIDALPLSIKDFKDEKWEDHILRQLARLYLQFYQLTFDQIGSLSLGEAGEDGLGSEPWVFGNRRPLQSSISEQALADQDPSTVIPLDRTYVSAVDYSYALVNLAFNDWLQSPDMVRSEEDGREDLYDLHHFRSYVMDWVIPEYNYGPFYLMHGDLLPSNILVDSNKNFVAIIDWEWCRTVPAQLFVPPAWITGFDITQACSGYGMIGLMTGTVFIKMALEKEVKADGKVARQHPLVKLWRQTVGLRSFNVAHALLRPDKSLVIYSNGLDHNCYGDGTRDSRVSAFYSAPDGNDKRKLVSKKLTDWESFKREVHELGMELKERESFPEINVPPDLQKRFEPTLMKKIFRKLRSQHQYVSRPYTFLKKKLLTDRNYPADA